MSHAPSREILVLKKGTPVRPAIAAFVEQIGLTTGTVQGIGALEQIELGFFDRERKVYDRRRVEGPHELLSLLGNVTVLDGEPFLHLHAVLSGPDFSVTGGHFFDAVVAVTLELFLDPWPADRHRRLDAESGLALMERPLPFPPLG